jgi:hypothetical protein
VWYFVFEGAGREDAIRLQLLGSEQELYERGDDPAQGFPIALPLDWSSSKVSRPEWTRSPVPSDVWMDLGHQLWRALPDPAKEPLRAKGSGQPCRVKIASNSSAIHDMPWEWLNSSGDGPLALRPHIRLSRAVPVRVAAPPLAVEPPVRVLLLVPNPKDDRLMSAFAEIEAIAEGVAASHYELKVLEEPTWEALVAQLDEYEPCIVHYVGHAGVSQGQGNLVVHDFENRSHWISGRELGQALPLSVRLLCLSTCFTVPNYQILGLSRLAHSPSTYRLPTTIANRYPVGGHGVRAFWRAFYRALIEEDGNANEAFHQAQIAAATAPLAGADWGSFALVIRDQSAQVMHLQGPGRKGRERREEEIQAQLISRLASDLAEIGRKGKGRPEILQKRFEQEADLASDLAEELGTEDEP